MDPNDFYYDDSDSSDSSSSGLLDSILSAGTSLAQTAILSNRQPTQTVPYPGPAGSYNAGSYYGGTPKSGGMSFLTVVLLVIAAVFAFSKLR